MSENPFVPSYHRVCSLHFTNSNFEKTSKLKNSAVPNIINNINIKTRRKLQFEHHVDHNYAISTIHEPIDLTLEQDTDKSGELILCNIIIIL